jgi:hypothetical protein
MPEPVSTAPTFPWRTRETSRHLMMAMAYSLGIALATGVALLLPLGNGHLTLIMLVAHLVSGALALVFFVPFLFVHLQDGKEPLRHLVMPWRMAQRMFKGENLYHRLIGYGLMWWLWLVFLSGLVIAAPAIAYLAGHPTTLPFGTSAWLLGLHLGFSELLVVFLLLHFPKRALS